MDTTRRALLSSSVAGAASVAGCSTILGSPDPDEPPESGVAEMPDPDDHIAGANGEWSSFGCNAANTREVGDGDAPVDGVSERWRVSVAQTAYRAPVVAGGRVFLLDPAELRVLDATDGTTLWTAPEVDAVPLVREGVAYVTTGDAVRALDAETGDRLWEHRPDTSGRVTQPATYAGDALVCGAGERVLSLDPASGDVQWHRDVFGQVLDHAAFFEGYWSVVATEAGMVYLFDDEGVGGWRWQLPAPHTAPPSAGTDSIYVPCRDGRTYALFGEQNDGNDVQWEADTGWAERGLAVVDDLVLAAGGNRLHAVDAASGDRHWEAEIGDWRHTAPAFGRDTVFVGGDRLRAFDPTPGDSPDGGPALRFEREFAGRVGPGPVIDDGTLYVVAEVESDEYALLALE
ncbi:Outer membrane protein assembly factor BamB, contains PQQ-like beta-propeller repeat [Halorientalis persicus]|uniref:Outer membrane protein assembly factor BamB, contains PQQ-like beta-propeller repeat n=1 Tax=Halorientalis persicus TaxID=1367881 RepID=A0A1H8JY62_9EURY|nr:PQQ-binding-like beta-propeller repeat protein [Halorientalis persicus]SEN85347.1 Outer membrane protein assembly factor BamB, contains PQQ-like beta-propeller repeat [Halorientalis persicus]